MRREKGIYHTLNKLSVDASHKVLVAEAWVPICAKARVHEALRTSAENSYTQVSGPGNQACLQNGWQEQLKRAGCSYQHQIIPELGCGGMSGGKVPVAVAV